MSILNGIMCDKADAADSKGTSGAAAPLRSVDPNGKTAHFNLASLLKSKGDVDGAEKHYRRALEIDPNDKVLDNNLASLFKSKDVVDGAEKHYRRALEIDPNDGALQPRRLAQGQG